ncbi:MAG: hypothetical protein KOO60_11340 [Gemmatimonadales bacterium]|nr:hypothetical protein [Gemmatimonadales bacterium]
MTNHPVPEEFLSVDWNTLSEKKDWSGKAWTAAAVLVILLGFFGGMVFRTSLTGGPDVTEEMVPRDPNTQNAPKINVADQYTGP